MTTTKIENDVLLLTKAKRQAARWMPFLSSVFMPMRCIRTNKVKTAAVDKYGRMYYNPDFVAKLGVDVMAYVILHETLHCVLSHCKRSDRMVSPKTPQNFFYANVAQDICIQQALKEQIGQFEPDNIVTLEKFAHIPGISAGRTSEQYYEAIMAYHSSKNPPPPPQGDDDEDEDSDDEQDEEESGSDDDSDDESDESTESEDSDQDEDGDDKSDGQDSDESDGDDETTDDAEDGDSDEDDESDGDSEADGEDDSDSEADDSGEQDSGGESQGNPTGEGDDSADGQGQGEINTEGLPDMGDILNPADAGSNSDGVEREYEDEPTLADISSLEKKLRDVETVLDDMDPRKGTVAGMLRESVKARLRPMPDPFDQLKHAVSKSIASPVGFPNLTYRKWPRRQLPGEFRLRGVERLQPEAVVLLDTSGSMLECSVKEKALAIVAKGISRLQNPRIVCCDGAVQSAKRVANMSRFTWDGGGGTDMAAGLVYVDKTYRPDTIVIITDGITGWPPKPTTAKVVCALCRPEWAARIPKWITVVHLYREGRKYAL